MILRLIWPFSTPFMKINVWIIVGKKQCDARPFHTLLWQVFCSKGLYLATYHYAIYPRIPNAKMSIYGWEQLPKRWGANQNKGIYKAANKIGLRFMELSPTNCGLWGAGRLEICSRVNQGLCMDYGTWFWRTLSASVGSRVGHFNGERQFLGVLSFSGEYRTIWKIATEKSSCGN